MILGGDFNCLMDKKDRMTVATVRLDSSSEMLNNLINDFELNDTLRNKNPNTPGYTWSNGTICSRIDFLLTTKNILVSDAAVTPVFFSDHSKIDCTITCHVKAHQGICRNHRDEFTTFYYLFYYLHNIFYYQHDIKQQGGGYAKHHLLLTMRYKCDTAAIPVALVMLLLLAPQNNNKESRGLHSRRTRRKIVQRGTKN